MIITGPRSSWQELVIPKWGSLTVFINIFGVLSTQAYHFKMTRFVDPLPLDSKLECTCVLPSTMRSSVGMTRMLSRSQRKGHFSAFNLTNRVSTCFGASSARCLSEEFKINNAECRMPLSYQISRNAASLDGRNARQRVCSF